MPEGAEPACAPEGMRVWPHVTTDYHGALVRLTTMRATRKQYLIFGYVELFPRDIPLPESFTTGDKPWAVPGCGGDITLAASALAMSVADALGWYEEATLGRVAVPRNRTPVDLAAPPFGVEPALGRFCVGENVPFAPPWHGGSRIHRLVPMEDPDQAVQSLGSSAAAREWLATNAGFDPYSFEEWLGSISLLAPDPLLLGLGHFTQGRGADGSERIILQAHRRRYERYPEAEADALKLVLLQRRPAGWTEVLPKSFDDDGFAITDYPEPVSETGYAICCPTRGLLRMVPPTLWMGQISVGLGLVDAVLDVEVPAGGRRKPASRYTSNRVVDAGGVHVGEALPPSGAIRIVELQEARKRRIEVESAPQRLFGAHASDKEDLTEEELTAMRAEAEAYVTGLVAGAQRRSKTDQEGDRPVFERPKLLVPNRGAALQRLAGVAGRRRTRLDFGGGGASVATHPRDRIRERIGHQSCESTFTTASSATASPPSSITAFPTALAAPVSPISRISRRGARDSRPIRRSLRPISSNMQSRACLDTLDFCVTVHRRAGGFASPASCAPRASPEADYALTFLLDHGRSGAIHRVANCTCCNCRRIGVLQLEFACTDPL